MLIDWFTVIAQIINFLILVWLLKRFLYKPILNAVDAREKLISEQLAEAENGKAEARKAQEDFVRRSAELERDRDALMRQADDEANARRVELLEAARKEFEEARAKWQETLQADEDLLTEEISSKARQELFLIARKILRDLADTDLEARMTETFIKKLRSLGAGEKKRLSDSFHAAAGTIAVRSAYLLTAEQQKALSAAAGNVLGTEAPIRFEVSEELISGIEMIVNSKKIHWNISDYLASLDEIVEEILLSRRTETLAPETDTTEDQSRLQGQSQAEIEPAPEGDLYDESE